MNTSPQSRWTDRPRRIRRGVLALMLSPACWLLLTGCVLAPESVLSPDDATPTRIADANTTTSTEPQGLAFVAPGRLAWEAGGTGIEYYTIYGSTGNTFDPMTATIVIYPLIPGHEVSKWPFDYYHVTATDRFGNESRSATIASSFTSRGERPPMSR